MAFCLSAFNLGMILGPAIGGETLVKKSCYFLFKSNPQNTQY